MDDAHRENALWLSQLKPGLAHAATSVCHILHVTHYGNTQRSHSFFPFLESLVCYFVPKVEWDEDALLMP